MILVSRCTIRGALSAAIASALVAGSPALTRTSAGAQAANYPSLQLPTASTRDYTAAIAAGSGTVALFQWREGAGPGMHLGLDAGVADYNGRDNLQLFVGGSIGKELLRAAGEQPLDLMLTGGVGAGFGGGSSLFRVPIGASVGHTFDLEQGMSLTPYVHPRLSIDICDDCGRDGDNRSEVSLNFDLGVNFQVNRQFGVRVAGSFSGSDFFGDDSFAVGLNWKPAGLRSRN
ncbi:MAG TPA: hypothetical protein VE869_07535 [Gemmatimonas sp.]|nr:hypothetical protein [Gemmatimonas sp.]